MDIMAIVNAAAIFSKTEQGGKLHDFAKMTSPLQFIFGKEISDELLHDLPWTALQSYGTALEQSNGGGGDGGFGGDPMSFFKAFGL